MHSKKHKLNILINNNAKLSIFHIFPTLESFSHYCSDIGPHSKNSIKLFVQFARANNLIREEAEEEFKVLIKNNQINNENAFEGWSFSEILEQMLNRRSVNSLISKLNIFADQFGMQKIQPSMFSRLKKDFNPNTPKKRNILRLFAFWMGLNNPQLGLDYERLLKIPQTNTVKQAHEEKEGVRIAFSLQAVGNIIDFRTVDWLMSELQQCIIGLKFHHINIKKTSYTLSTSYIDFQKTSGPEGEPRLYGQAIRECLALAYQISIRWSLSKHSNQQRSLVIAINAGPFDQADKYLHALLSVKTPGATRIVVSEFTRLCARIADVKVIFSKTPLFMDIDIPGGTNLTAWFVDTFWSHLYFDFIPELLEETILPTTKTSYENFKNALYFPDQSSVSNKALSAIRKSPQDAFLAIEISKVLVARRMFYEAVEMLSTILASFPLHILARTFRMIIYRHLFTQQTDFDIAENIFIRAVEESNILLKYYSEESEVLIESGLVYYSRAIQLITNIRIKDNHTLQEVDKIFLYLKSSLDLFHRSVAISPVLDMRAEFWCRQTKVLQEILKSDDSLLDRNSILTDKYDIIYIISMQTWKEIGWIKTESQEELESFFNRTFLFVQQYSKNISLANYIPSLKCICAAQFWNTLPNINVFIAKMIISAYEEAISDVEKLSKHKIGIYSNTGCYTHIQTPEHFIENAMNYIHMIKNVLGTDLDCEDDFIIDRKKIRKIALPFAFLDNENNQDPIVVDT